MPPSARCSCSASRVYSSANSSDFKPSTATELPAEPRLRTAAIHSTLFHSSRATDALEASVGLAWISAVADLAGVIAPYFIEAIRDTTEGDANAEE